MEGGGYATVRGVRYQGLWTARLLLQVLAEELRSVRIEPAGAEGEGIDLIVEAKDGTRELHQCKRCRGQSGKWTMAALAEEGVLAAIRDRLSLAPTATYKLVSSDPAPDLADLATAARDSEGPESFYEYQVKAARSRTAAFAAWCERLSLDLADERDRAQAWALLSRTFTVPVNDGPDADRDLETMARLLVSGSPRSALAVLRTLAHSLPWSV